MYELYWTKFWLYYSLFGCIMWWLGFVLMLAFRKNKSGPLSTAEKRAVVVGFLFCGPFGWISAVGCLISNYFDP